MTLIINNQFKFGIKLDWDSIRIKWRVQTSIDRVATPLIQDNKLNQILAKAADDFKAIGDRGIASIKDERRFINRKDKLEGISNE